MEPAPPGRGTGPHNYATPTHAYSLAVDGGGDVPAICPAVMDVGAGVRGQNADAG
jgi:hypothetical protein